MTTLYLQTAPEMAYLRRRAERMRNIRSRATAAAPRTWKPAAAMRDLGDRYELQFQLPGINADSLDIQASQNGVTVVGDRPATQAQLIHSEFRTGQFKRGIRLPEAVQHQSISAQYADGLLTLSLPKLTAAPDYSVRVAISEASTSAEANPEVNSERTGEVESATEETVAVAEDTAAPEATVIPATEADDVWAESV